MPESGSASPRPEPDDEPYNIIPVGHLESDHPSFRYPEVSAAISALKAVNNLRKPPGDQWHPSMDLLDWLGFFFGFQRDNVKNQREHLVLHLANSQMRLSPPSQEPDILDTKVLRKFRRKLLKNYTDWCSYLWKKSNVWIPSSSNSNSDHSRELLYVGLYLLIWGESANLRFMPECICYIFHHMAMELNKILRNDIDEKTGSTVMPSTSGENAFLNSVVKPIYETIKAEVERSKNGTAPHSSWRNYDDLNEYFWSNRCFKKLKWPIDLNSEFFVTSSTRKRIKKIGFVEQRSFWSLFRSFDRLWVMLVLFLQAAVIATWEEKRYPWEVFNDKDVEIKLLTLFITWSGMGFLHALLEAGMEYGRVSQETLRVGIRMVLKIVVAAAWFCAFVTSYGRIWTQRNRDGQWSGEANKRVNLFLRLAFLYGLPELMSLDFIFFPLIRNFIEKTNLNWKLFYPLSWWFLTDSFVGEGLREGLFVHIKYILFWFVVLATKFSFSYYLQIKPMITTTKQLLNFNDGEYEWKEFLGMSNKLVLGLLWMPVLLIYLIDTQIWYSIYSPFVGTMVGLFQHVGEIRNIEQFKLWFQLFSAAIQFHLMPPEGSLSRGVRSSLVNIFKDVVDRLKLRYGVGQPYGKIESSQVQASRFALIWNEIISIFREEDILSDHETELLELPHNCWNIRVIRWPCFLLCNELKIALRQAQELKDATDDFLWSKICKKEYRRCAVIETYDSVKHLILEIISRDTEEHSILLRFFYLLDNHIETRKFTCAFKMIVLPRIHAKFIKLVELLLEPYKDVKGQVVNTLQALYELTIREFFRLKVSIVELRQLGLAPCSTDVNEGLLFENAIQLPDPSNEYFFRQVRRLHTILTTTDLMHKVPANPDARRRLAFFSNSLFMQMPRAPNVEKMMAFSVLTPYFNEEVLYGKEELQIENEDGISILYYLQTVYDDEWKNFMERMRREGMEDDDEIWTTKVGDLRLWASYRGQTLARTVRGMAYCYRALNLLAFLESASEMDIRMATDSVDNYLNGFNNKRSSSSQNLSRTSNLFKGHESGIVSMKYTHVVSCQQYGEQNSDEVMYLMRQNKGLRIAYVKEVLTGREKEYCSVLVKYDQESQREVEIYRVKLPGPFKLGEGKPENQNHALIFTRGDALQAIDMNQDNYFEEALKMRNLLEEFKHYHGVRKPTILGIREYIFSGSVSSLAWFMSAQETSFVTLVQRLLANPLKIRMHYGHPDVFDRFWFISRGGISKASKVGNINEDIFAGFNCTLRGGCVTHHEYIQVGKGRDLGMNQISMFEAKIAGGNGEQVLSRDVYRLGQRLDFFRMLSFFHTTVGYFFNTTMIVLTVYVFLWGQLYLTLGGVEDSSDLGNEKNLKKALVAVFNQEVLVQFGFLTTFPMIIESSLENGFLGAIWELVLMQLQLSVAFYAFSMGTRAHFFGRTILHGGAKYQATGRGFVVHHTSFAENYRLFSRSHFIKAIELGLILTVCALYAPVASKNTFSYIDTVMTCWFLVLSWLLAPFLFNPSGFDWFKTVKDFDDFMTWIWHPGGVFAKPEQSWESWWYNEQDYLRTTGLCGKLLKIILDLRFFFFQYGIVYHLGVAAHSKSISGYLFSWIYIFVAFGIYFLMSFFREKYEAKKHILFRLVQSLVIIIGVLVLIVLLQFTAFKFCDIFTGLLAIMPTGWGIMSIAQVFRPYLQPGRVWDSVAFMARAYDILFGAIVMAPVAFLSGMPGVQSMQTRILFNEAFGRGLQMFKFISAGKQKKDLEGSLDLR